MKNLEITEVNFNLTCFYKDVDDSQIGKDVELIKELGARFLSRYRGKVPEFLHNAISEYAEIAMLINKLAVYFTLLNSQNTGNIPVEKMKADVEGVLYAVIGECEPVFNLGLLSIGEEELQRLSAEDELVRHHLPLFRAQQRFAPHILDETTEGILVALIPFRRRASRKYSKEESAIRFANGTISDALSRLTVAPSAGERRLIMDEMNEKANAHLVAFAAEALDATAEWAKIEHRFRKYRSPIESRNLVNYIPDKAVEALHQTVYEYAGRYVRRFYELKRRLLGVPSLHWSDKDASLPFAEPEFIPFSAAMEMVVEAYEGVSPILGGIVRKFLENGWIDAGVMPGKSSGAFNMSTVLPEMGPVSFTFLNYLGTLKDVRALAHEFGHGVHGILGGEAQGQLMISPPSSYSEIASIFGEKIVFEGFRKKLQESGNKKALLAFVVRLLDWTMNKVVMQMAFSDFERRLHGMDARFEKWGKRKIASPGYCGTLWREVRERYFGKEGTVFSYENTEHIWAYVTKHLHGQLDDHCSPFHVYSYAESELAVAGIFAKRETLGGAFAERYIEALRSGSTKSFPEVLDLFGVDPMEKSFWENGMEESLGKLLDEAEALSRKLGLT